MNKASPLKPAAPVVLNRLLRILARSLPMYMEAAKPWSGGGQQPAQDALKSLVADQHRFAGRVAEAIFAGGGQPEPGPFPAAFAAMNDASLDYLLRRVIELLRGDLPAIERCALELADAPEFRALAEEVLGNAQAHLDLLQGLTP